MQEIKKFRYLKFQKAEHRRAYRAIRFNPINPCRIRYTKIMWGISSTLNWNLLDERWKFKIILKDATRRFHKHVKFMKVDCSLLFNSSYYFPYFISVEKIELVDSHKIEGHVLLAFFRKLRKYKVLKTLIHPGMTSSQEVQLLIRNDNLEFFKSAFKIDATKDIDKALLVLSNKNKMIKYKFWVEEDFGFNQNYPSNLFSSQNCAKLFGLTIRNYALSSFLTKSDNSKYEALQVLSISLRVEDLKGGEISSFSRLPSLKELEFHTILRSDNDWEKVLDQLSLPSKLMIFSWFLQNTRAEPLSIFPNKRIKALGSLKQLTSLSVNFSAKYPIFFAWELQALKKILEALPEGTLESLESRQSFFGYKFTTKRIQDSGLYELIGKFNTLKKLDLHLQCTSTSHLGNNKLKNIEKIYLQDTDLCPIITAIDPSKVRHFKLQLHREDSFLNQDILLVLLNMNNLEELNITDQTLSNETGYSELEQLLIQLRNFKKLFSLSLLLRWELSPENVPTITGYINRLTQVKELYVVCGKLSLTRGPFDQYPSIKMSK